jgi:hypothetical protein
MEEGETIISLETGHREIRTQGELMDMLLFAVKACLGLNLLVF